jgi:formamidopyrimidine-DNA glycosylase
VPELPEIETICRGLQGLSGMIIVDSKAYVGKLRKPIPSAVFSLGGSVIHEIYRKAKYVIIRLDGDRFLLLHLGMSGRLIYQKSDYDFIKHDHFYLRLQNGNFLVFNDPRRFGLIDLVTKAELDNYFVNYGPDPFDRGFTAEYLFRRLQNLRSPIKIALMNNKLVVGVGNIYANESLFKAKIHPETISNRVNLVDSCRLIEAIKLILSKAINAGGSSLKDFVNSQGVIGYFQNQFSVYARDGELCNNCSAVIKKIKQGNRSSFFCPKCQPLLEK